MCIFSWFYFEDDLVANFRMSQVVNFVASLMTLVNFVASLQEWFLGSTVF